MSVAATDYAEFYGQVPRCLLAEINNHLAKSSSEYCVCIGDRLGIGVQPTRVDSSMNTTQRAINGAQITVMSPY